MRNDVIALMAEATTSVAVVGATDTPGKYGGRIYRNLKEKGYRVFAVNPNAATVDGDPAYPDLASLPEAPTIVDFVVPPEVTLDVLSQARDLGMTKVWIQPGAGDVAVDDFLATHGFDAVADGSCIMVLSRHVA